MKIEITVNGMTKSEIRELVNSWGYEGALSMLRLEYSAGIAKKMLAWAK